MERLKERLAVARRALSTLQELLLIEHPSVAEIFLFRVSTHVHKGQHGNLSPPARQAAQSNPERKKKSDRSPVSLSVC